MITVHIILIGYPVKTFNYYYHYYYYYETDEGAVFSKNVLK